MTEITEFTLTHVAIFDGEKITIDQALTVRGDSIIAIGPMGHFTATAHSEINCQGLLATAGFVDLQINGCGGVLLNEQIEENTLTTIQNTNLKYGTTQCLPTFVTSSLDELQQLLTLF